MPKNKQMKYFPGPEVSLLQSAINKVTEENSPSNNGNAENDAIADDSSGVNIIHSKINRFIDGAENYAEAAFDTITEKVSSELSEAKESGSDAKLNKVSNVEMTADINFDQAPKKYSLNLSPDAVMKKLSSQNVLLNEQNLLAKDNDFTAENLTTMAHPLPSFLETPEYCINLAVKYAHAKVQGNTQQANDYFEELHMPFGDCDPNYISEIGKVYAEFLLKSHLLGAKIDYRETTNANDFVFTDKLPENATVAIIGDWGTGQDAALKVLEQVQRKNPDVIIHLGDIYYSGVQYEVDNYFIKPFNEVFGLNGNFNLQKPFVFNLAGNHDMYSGGTGYYYLVDQLKQKSSYFCLRNENWQFIAIDTGYNSRLLGGNTYLREDWGDGGEVGWLKDKVNSFDGRTVLLSHHQLFSATSSFDDKKPVNENLYKQVEDILPKVDIWFWGHEHDLFVFNPYLKLERGRCLGASAYPIGKDEVEDNYNEVPFVLEARPTLENDVPFYQHSYAIMKLTDNTAMIGYFQDGNETAPLYREEIN